MLSASGQVFVILWSTLSLSQPDDRKSIARFLTRCSRQSSTAPENRKGVLHAIYNYYKHTLIDFKGN